MRERRAGKAAALAATMAGLAASAVLLVDYLKPAPVFCDAGSGCGALKHTAYAAFLGIPTPAFGIAAFVAFAALWLAAGARARAMLVALAGVAGAVAAFLLAVQFRVGRFCVFCMVVDLSTLLVFALAGWRLRARWDLALAPAGRALAGTAFAAALAAPLLIGAYRPPLVPAVIAAELSRTPRDRITVIDFADFECPYCRQAHAALAPFLSRMRERIRLVRKQVPLTGLHSHALDAARAACCGETLGRGEAMADALFSAPPGDLTPEGCARLAGSVGIDAARFGACLRDASVDARIRTDSADFRAAGGHGLPTIWIDRQKIEGAHPPAVFERALATALASKSN